MLFYILFVYVCFIHGKSLGSLSVIATDVLIYSKWEVPWTFFQTYGLQALKLLLCGCKNTKTISQDCLPKATDL